MAAGGLNTSAKIRHERVKNSTLEIYELDKTAFQGIMYVFLISHDTARDSVRISHWSIIFVCK